MTTTPDPWRNPFIDNTDLTGNQRDGVVAATNADQFFAAWVDFQHTPDDIILRKFDILGNPITGEVNLRDSLTNFTVDLLHPAVARLPIAGAGDGLAVAWEDIFSATDHDIFVSRFNAGLTNIDAPPGFIVIDNSNNTISHDPSITSFSNGSLWVAYTLNGDINARRVAADGSTGPIITLADFLLSGTDFSDLTTLANQNFVAVFEVNGFLGNDDVFYTIRDNAGNQIVAPTPVPGGADATDEFRPHVAALADGGFVVVWDDDGTNTMRATVFAADGSVVQSNINVSFFGGGGEIWNDVTGLPDGGFIVDWADGNLLRAQRFDEAGNLDGTLVTVGNFNGLGFNSQGVDAATYSDGRAIFTFNVTGTGDDVQTAIWDTRITDANQTTGENFFGAGGGPADLFLIRDIVSGGIPVRQLEAIQTNGSATVFGTVGTNQHFVGSGDFNGDGLSDLLINVDSGATGTRQFLVDQMNPGGIQTQVQIAVRGADWVVDAAADFNHNGTDDILVHRDIAGARTLEVMVMNNNVVTANTTIGVNGVTWDVDGTGDFNNDGTPDVLQHQINLSAGSMTLRDLVISPNAVQVQSAPTMGTIGSTWQVDGVGDFNHDGTADILIHQDSSSTGARTFQVLTIQNNAVVAGTTIAVTGTNISVGGVGDFNNDGTSDFLVHQDSGTTRTDIVYNVVNNVAVSTQTVAVTGIDWHVA